MKNLLLAIVGFFISIGMAFAAVDINKADLKELDAIKGIGPVKAKAIVDERTKNGPFKSLDDVEKRVKGVGPATTATWKKDGSVNVDGVAAPTKADAKKADKPKSDAGKDAAPKSDAKADMKKDAPKADAKADMKADAKKDAPKADMKADAKKDAPAADAGKEAPKK